MGFKSLKGVFAKAARRRRAIAQTKPWQALPFGWKDRLENADHQIILAMRAHPKRFRVQVDPHDPDTAIVTTPTRRPTRHSRQIAVRLPKAMFEIRGMNRKKGGKVYEPFFLEMLNRNGSH